MKTESKKIIAVPTNVITGFLGVGKTSIILHLLKQKPQDERWAILVNEFGEIGIDGNILALSPHKSNNLFIKEVPGGCMCCSSSLSMQIALNQLLKEAQPHRVLIEPTGLGHPHEVIKLLSNQYYRNTLILEKTLTLVDARHLADKRYTENETFNQQLLIADTIIANKEDLYNEQDKAHLSQYLTSSETSNHNLYFTKHGAVKLTWLSGKTMHKIDASQTLNQHSHTLKPSEANPDIPSSGFIKAINKEEGYWSIGWRFSQDKIFNRTQLISFVQNVAAIRVKAVFKTTEGCFSYNNTSDGLNEKEVEACKESRIEIICDSINNRWESLLRQAIND